MKHIKNPKDFLMLSLNQLEASTIAGKFINKCEECGKESETLCYIAQTEKFLCPCCMRAFVYSSMTKTYIEKINYINACAKLKL